MNDFKDAYRSAIQDTEEFHIDVSSCMDENKHRQRVIKHARRATTTAFSAMCVLFVCGFGSVKASDYIQNVVKVSKWGFESADTITMAQKEAGYGRSYIIEEQADIKIAEEESPMLMAIEEGGQKEDSQANIDGSIQNLEEQKVMEGAFTDVSGNSVTDNSVPGNSVSGNMLAKQKSDILVTSTEQKLENKEQELPIVYYTSLEEFEENEDIIFPQPSISIGKKLISTEVTVSGGWAMVRYEADNKVLWIERTDYAGTEGHTSSKVFPGGAANERTYTTPDNYTYLLVNSGKESSDKKSQIHAAITVGSYEMFIDFLGFEETDAKRVIDSIDVSLYE